ncbi:MAG: hypothetical protein FD143_662 [Ignavibacteria bacterium]|nr:MAG: hypothetical protein FD143_662 [Ignavibacteria bacterium]KAF0161275.1 MAG: hypothetical protein FD188_863 [Ignavibacteria bacterium]
MKIVRVLFFLFIPLVFINAQGMRRQADPATLEKIEQMENARLIKLLDLSEEQSIRFFARRKEYLQKMHELLQKRRDFIDSTQDLLKEDESENQKKFNDKVEEVFELEAKIFKEKRHYYKSLSNLISPKQVLQLMTFEERFRREVREKLADKQNRKKSE